jgi:hypothetical protein
MARLTSTQRHALTVLSMIALFSPVVAQAWEPLFKAENGQVLVETNTSRTGGGWPTFKKTQFVVRPELISKAPAESDLRELLDPRRHGEIWGHFEYDPQQKGELLVIQDAYVPAEILNRPGALVTTTDMDINRTPILSRVIQITSQDSFYDGQPPHLQIAVYAAKLIQPSTGKEIRSLSPEAFGARVAVDWENPIAKARFQGCTL